jgi:hypothetical protein
MDLYYMAFSFNNNKKTFNVEFKPSNSGDYISKKKAELLYKTNYYNKINGTLNSQENLLEFKKAENIRDVETINPSLPAIYSYDILSGNHSTENLSNINVIKSVLDSSNCSVCVPSNITANLNQPIYYNYNLDPCNSLFSQNKCGVNKYCVYRNIVKPVILSSQNMQNCVYTNCKGYSSDASNNTFFSYTGNPNIVLPSAGNGYKYVFTFTNNGSIKFFKDLTLNSILVGGGGGGGGNPISNGNAGGGGGGGGSVIQSSIKIIKYINYNITIGNGGIGGTTGVPGSSGGNTSITYSDYSINAYGGSGGSIGYGGGATAVGGAGGNGGSGGGNGGYGYGYPSLSIYGGDGTTITTIPGITSITYGGGGAGSSYGATGGSGGGGSSWTSSTDLATSGTSNTGGGGGSSRPGLGSNNLYNNYPGANGGSGIVIIYF